MTVVLTSLLNFWPRIKVLLRLTVLSLGRCLQMLSAFRQRLQWLTVSLYTGRTTWWQSSDERTRLRHIRRRYVRRPQVQTFSRRDRDMLMSTSMQLLIFFFVLSCMQFSFDYYYVKLPLINCRFLLSFFLILGWHTLPSHASAEACLTGWPNAQPQGRD